MKRIYVFILIVTFSTFTKGQIAITEVYYDTPVIERVEKTDKAHAGEFVELFNYTNEAIDISRWRLSDHQGSYFFPQGTIIQAGDYIVVARKIRSVYGGNYNYFFTMFPEVQTGNENKLLYQNKFLLHNYDDGVTLSMKNYRGIELKRYYKISTMVWECGRTEQNSSLPCDIAPASEDALLDNYAVNSQYDYHTLSFQKLSNNQFIQTQQNAISLSNNYHPANPFGLTFTPHLLDEEEISHLNDILIDNYDLFTWDEDVSDLVNNQCNLSVNTITETVISDDVIEEQCFGYDNAGNQSNTEPCITTGDGDANADNWLEEIANQIYVAPNPTYNTVTLYWEADISNLISYIVIVPINGGFEIPVNFSNGANSVTINLSSYLNGLYVAKFQINTGHFINKTIIKI